MGTKRKSTLGFTYLIGLIILIVGFCCPVFYKYFEIKGNGFNFIDFNSSKLTSVGSLLIFGGAAFGALLGIFSLLKIKIPKIKLITLVTLILIFAGIILFGFGYYYDYLKVQKFINGIINVVTGTSKFKLIFDAFVERVLFGFYVILSGWIVSLIGWIISCL